jgi:hypothetical protein
VVVVPLAFGVGLHPGEAEPVVAGGIGLAFCGDVVVVDGLVVVDGVVVDGVGDAVCPAGVAVDGVGLAVCGVGDAVCPAGVAVDGVGDAVCGAGDAVCAPAPSVKKKSNVAQQTIVKVFITCSWFEI